MTLSDHQNFFAKDVIKLLQFIDGLGIKFTLGEVYRTDYQHSHYMRMGLSKTKNTMHKKRCAIDINVFIDGKPVYDRKNYYLNMIGTYWESLSPINRWGGNFKSLNDGGHFERYVK